MAKKSKLQEALEEGGCETRDYSGRGMFGETCLAVDGSLKEVLVAVASAVTDENREDVVEALRSCSTDSMGLGVVVYFPGTPYVGDDEDCDEEDEADAAE